MGILKHFNYKVCLCICQTLIDKKARKLQFPFGLLLECVRRGGPVWPPKTSDYHSSPSKRKYLKVCHCEAARPWQSHPTATHRTTPTVIARSEATWQSPGTILDKSCTKGEGRAKQVPSTFHCTVRYMLPGDSHGPMALGMTCRYIFLLVVTARRSLRWRAGHCPAPTEALPKTCHCEQGDSPTWQSPVPQCAGTNKQEIPTALRASE